MRIDKLALPAMFVAFSGVILWQSLTSMDYYLPARHAPGPGFLPFWLALGVGLLGIVQIAREVITARSPKLEPSDTMVMEFENAWPGREGAVRILFLMASFAAAIWFLDMLGFLVTASVFIAVVSYGLGLRQLRIVIPSAVGASLVMHAIFVIWLQVSLPEGVMSSVLSQVGL